MNNSLSLKGVVIASGILGFFLGAFRFPQWQDAIEGAQLLSGVVTYTSATPFYLYLMKAWTLLHQIPALFLWMGATETQVALFLSGCMGMLSYQCLALTLYALTGGALVAVLIPFLIDYTAATLFYSAYPLFLMGSSNTYGVIGFSWIYLTLLLLSLERYRWAGFFLGIAPALHFPLAVTLYFIVGMTLILTPSRSRYRAVFWPFVIGLLLSILSYAIQQSFSGPDYNQILPIFLKNEYSQFVKEWEGHRKMIPYSDKGLWLNILVIFLIGFYTSFSKPRREAMFFLRAVQFTAAASLLVAGLSHIPVEKLPLWFTSPIPGRMLNIAILSYVPVMFGICWSLRNVYTTLFVLMTVITLATTARFFPDHTPTALVVLGTLLVGLLLILREKTQPVTAPTKKIESISRILIVFSLAAFLLKALFFTAQPGSEHRERWIDWRKDPFLKQVKQGQGILLTGPDLGHAQLLTRRPILIHYEGLDILAYFPELGPLSFDIIKKIYGVNVLLPPQENTPELIKTLWEKRTLEEWLKIQKDYGVTQVITSSEWRLKIPKVTENELMKLYAIA